MREPRRGDQGGALQGVVRLRLQSDKRTIDHPFIAQPNAQRQPGKPPFAAARASPASRRTCCAGRCGCRCAPRSASCTTGPAVLVRVEDGEGAFGWGEAWCNFPSCGAEHRARLIETRARAARRRPRVRLAARGLRRADGADRGARDPVGRAGADRAGDRRRRHRPARPRGAARRTAAVAPSARRPARRRTRRRRATVPVYASGINPERPGDTVAALRDAGHTAFKLKVGFGAARDVDNLAAVRAAAGARRRRDGRRQPGLGPRRRRSRWRRRLAELAPGLARGAAARRPALARVAASRRGVRRFRSPPARTRSATTPSTR